MSLKKDIVTVKSHLLELANCILVVLILKKSMKSIQLILNEFTSIFDLETVSSVHSSQSIVDLSTKITVRFVRVQLENDE